MGGIEEFHFCDIVPEEYRIPFANESLRGFPKRDVFARTVQKNVLGPLGLERYTSPVGVPQEIIQGIYSDSYGSLYKEAFEGIFQQLFSELDPEKSKLFVDEDYATELEERVAGRSKWDVLKRCIKNKYNLSHEGILAFDEMITENFQEEFSKELSNPENAPENLDYTAPGPTERAFQNLIIRGIIKLSLIELLLKGALAYTVWDIETKIGDSFFREYVYKFIDIELSTIGVLRYNQDQVNETLTRMTSIENREMAIRKIISQEIVKIPDLSKQVYDNEYGFDYYDLFLN